jgi:hypothetical protein
VTLSYTGKRNVGYGQHCYNVIYSDVQRSSNSLLQPLYLDGTNQVHGMWTHRKALRGTLRAYDMSRMSRR